jgi:hypothetical protein
LAGRLMEEPMVVVGACCTLMAKCILAIFRSAFICCLMLCRGVDRKRVGDALSLLARQHQLPDAGFPSITDKAGTDFILKAVREAPFDLIILDNFSTLGQVEDENAASSFNAIQEFLLRLKVEGIATMLVHHAGKSRDDRGGDFRGSSKLAATFETIIKLEHLGRRVEYGNAQFRVRWDKVRAGGPQRRVREVVAKLVNDVGNGKCVTTWDFEDQGLERLDEVKEHLEAGELINQKEIGDLCGVSKPTAKTYIDKGIRIGIWTEEQLSRWFARGKARRHLKQTEPPVRPSSEWMSEDTEDDPNATLVETDL